MIRLGWAEILSEFDRPAPLESLSGLPGWPEVPMELRRTLQSFVDWLFSRIDRNQPQAKNAINELVRVAMLMGDSPSTGSSPPAGLAGPCPAQGTSAVRWTAGSARHLALIAPATTGSSPAR